MMSTHLLLIHPWIYDFAAFDLWLKPLGLLYLAGHLRQHGYQIALLDCVDRANPAGFPAHERPAPSNRAYGTGKFLREPLPKPAVLRHIPETYCRYGIPEEVFVNRLSAIPTPDAILLTSLMTYWYPGVFRAIELVKQHFPDVPVILGGGYARLCSAHARAHAHADYVVTDDDPRTILALIDDITGAPPNLTEPYGLFDVAPAFDLYPHLDYACVLTSSGCPYRCTYCASHILASQFVQRPPEHIFQELLALYEQRGVRHFAFYDDALLVRSENHLEPLLEQVLEAKLNCTFHAPNGLHARHLTERAAALMFASGFQTIRLGLETADAQRQRQTGGKVTGDEFSRAIAHLKRAGFQGTQIGVYVLIGLPGQSVAEVAESIRCVHSLGVKAHLCEYSPIPGTPDWQTLEAQGSVSSADDPLLHNNSVFLFQHNRYTFEQIQTMKDLVRDVNRRLASY